MIRSCSRILKQYRRVLIVVPILLISACGGGGGGTSVSITISPTTATLVAGASTPFAASVSGTSNQAVTWAVTGVGSVSATGVYTAPSSGTFPATATVTVTSAADTSKKASATITVTGTVSYFGTFTSAGSMRSARSNHTANLLTNGQVLVTGGLGSLGTAIASAEVFRPTFASFTSVGSMSNPRAYQSATMLTNGKILVAGGVDATNVPLASAEIYDPATGKFSATGAMTTARAFHSATLLANGKVLVCGGNSNGNLAAGNALDSAELYDPVTGRFTATVPMITARYYHTATLLPDGQVLLTGGVGIGGARLPAAELYDPITDTFTATDSMLVDPAVDTGRWLHTATLLQDGSVVIVGGDMGTHAANPSYLNTAQLYDPAAALGARFSDIAGTLTDPRGHHTATRLADLAGSVLVTGGFGGTAASGATYLASAELYDPVAHLFAATGALAQSRANHTAVLLPGNGRILVIGGNTALQTTDSNGNLQITYMTLSSAELYR
ncbi:hypothetical protein [Geobacter sp. AOG2]|uniref:hypothetical protein n=1 Tax=Geobacter sp. AOG2 TaxID=1566347 RepID=UPI001CC42808|nr:hypothetical protein [Geobacter sp. AOG2]GFE60551.1 hypothetical protein AOG2_11390 [Geobacter sp. AOG2]